MTTEGAVAGAARTGFASGMMGLGLLSLIYGSYSLQWEPIPGFVPTPLAYLSGAILILAAAALAVRGAAAGGALVLMAFLGLWLVALKIPETLAVMPRVTTVSGALGTLLGAFQDIALMCGAWTLYVLSVRCGAKPVVTVLSGEKALRAIRILFGITCIECGLCHFAFADITANLVPAWLPDHLFVAYLTGAGHLCAGIALVTGVLPRLAATLEAAMMSLFVLLVQVPMVLWHRAGEGHHNWILLFVASSLAASAGAIAGAMKDQPWGVKMFTAGSALLKKA